MPKLTTTEVVKHEVKIAGRLATKILTELRGYAALKSQRDSLTAKMDAHRESVLTLGMETGETKFEIEGIKVALVLDSTKKSLDKKRLLKRLVTAGLSVKNAQACIDDATTEKPTKAHAKIRLPNEHDGGEDE